MADFAHIAIGDRSLHVDGVSLAHCVTDVEVSNLAGSVSRVAVTFVGYTKVEFAEGQLIVGGVKMPEAMELALFKFLADKHTARRPEFVSYNLLSEDFERQAPMGNTKAA